jgi:outer membrane protein OmpA-like peptidoglycan-associated protein
MTVRSFALAALAVAALTSCATGATLRAEAETMRSQLDSARKAGAYRCVPRELAIAESHLEFLENELDQGNAVRAASHKNVAKEALVTVIAKSKGCAPEPIAVAPAPKDRDGDGIPDENDACPNDPGPEKFLGCPDRDADGIPDNLDKCPTVPEDFDGVEDEDGCPDEGDRDGDTLLDRDDGCPDVAGPVANKGCPYGDRDGDKILDDADKCPDTPEDPDGWEDEDGCPDPDNDGDGIVDASDKCPVAPETRNNFEDDDGCPDTKLDLVEVRRDLGKIEIKQKVFFDTGKATIKPVSFPLLNQVAQVLKDYPTMMVLVEGHTDSVGGHDMNVKLSDARAESVREYMIGQGVPSSRLTAQGFGPDRPIESNRTAKGREQNRRVEFTITKE